MGLAATFGLLLMPSAPSMPAYTATTAGTIALRAVGAPVLPLRQDSNAPAGEPDEPARLLPDEERNLGKPERPWGESGERNRTPLPYFPLPTD